jgi:hypothetical protein
MKAAALYILFICFGLLAAHSHVHAIEHNGKLSFAATHNTVHKQRFEAISFIDVEDESDEKYFTRIFTHHAGWISTIVCTVFSMDPQHHFIRSGGPKRL